MTDLPTPHAVQYVKFYLLLQQDTGVNKILVYLDDLLVCFTTFNEHLDRFLQRSTDAGLKLRLDKCQFLRRQVHYLGHTICPKAVSCGAGKVEAVKKWPVPTTTTAIRSFLGFVGASSRAFLRWLTRFMT